MKRRFGYNGTNNKFGGHKTVYKGIEFDSWKERDYYLYLCHMQNVGRISGLRVHTPFVLIPQTTKIVPKQLKTKVRYDTVVVEQDAGYHNDFSFFDKENNVYVCCEYKSEATSKLPDYILRRKLMIRKIYEHNAKGRSRWVFREIIYYKDKTTTEDK